MSYLFNVVFRPKPGTQEGKWYASLKSRMKVTEKEIAREIADMTSLSVMDVMGVISAFLYLIPKYLLLGARIKLGDLGCFRLLAKSKGMEKEEDVDSACIESTRPYFQCSTTLRNSVRDMHFEKAENKKKSNP